jgi:MHS family proline/betaine transporter-like MFS transporter
MLGTIAHRVVAANIGNVVEWFDFAVFGFLAPEFGRIFFDSHDKSEALLRSFAIFGAAFMVRPIGGLLLGYLGDKYGRKLALEISILLMTVSMCGMVLLPTYSMIGEAAPLLLLICRICQGLSVGGQLVGAMLYAVEGAPKVNGQHEKYRRTNTC